MCFVLCSLFHELTDPVKRRTSILMNSHCMTELSFCSNFFVLSALSRSSSQKSRDSQEAPAPCENSLSVEARRAACVGSLCGGVTLHLRVTKCTEMNRRHSDKYEQGHAFADTSSIRITIGIVSTHPSSALTSG